MLWPYVRNPGDCLTDGEVAAGARGVYNGPVNTNPDIGAMQQSPAPAPVQPALPGAPPPAVSRAPAVSLAPAGAPAPVANYNAVAPTTAADCTKGRLWPFVKKPGDCLTSVEKTKRTGPLCYYQKPGDCQIETEKKVGVVTGYGGVGPVATAQAIAASAPVTPVGAPGANVPVVPSCTKGPLWPFVKRPGDCSTTAEQKRGK
jgi:hypothetical protein